MSMAKLYEKEGSGRFVKRQDVLLFLLGCQTMKNQRNGGNE